MRTPAGILAWVLLSALCFSPAAAAVPPAPLQVDLVTDEADAVLAILTKTAAGETPAEADWQRLFTTEGYVRLKKREAWLKRDFTDSEFKQFVLSDELAGRRDALADTLARWKQADVNGAAARALAYLPPGARIRAKIYPVIKPQTNSFVFETTTDPAIFLYLDPEKTATQFENTLAHELHHIGYSAACAGQAETEEAQGASPSLAHVRRWVWAFGEGIAMLAAAGGPDVHPHAASPATDRQRWDHDVAQFDADLHRVEGFFLDILEGRLVEPDEIEKIAFSFFGVQGPWYTVGWKMAATVEKAYGRPALFDCLCEPQKLLATYNRAAQERGRASSDHIAIWSPALLEALKTNRDLSPGSTTP